MRLRLSIVDLDDTLYCARSGVFARMDRRIRAFIERTLGVDARRADRLRVAYWRRYGSTLRGLMLHHGIEPEPFLREAHDVSPEELLAPDPALDRALAAWPGSKVIHTNATREHAERVLDALGVAHHFDAIYDIRFDAYRPKPNPAALSRILDHHRAQPAETLVVDDQAANLRVAAGLGCRTAAVGAAAQQRGWDWSAARIHDLASALAAPERRDRPPRLALQRAG